MVAAIAAEHPAGGADELLRRLQLHTVDYVKRVAAPLQ